MDWEDFHTMEDMYTYLAYLEQTYDFVTVESIGESYEGQDMRVAKVCRGGCGDKPAMWVDGGILKTLTGGNTKQIYGLQWETGGPPPSLVNRLKFQFYGKNPGCLLWPRKYLFCFIIVS